MRRGCKLIVVGEWAGDTADASFTAALVDRFQLVLQLQLPNWSDTAHELTVWKRRAGTDKKGKKRQSVSQVRPCMAPRDVRDWQRGVRSGLFKIPQDCRWPWLALCPSAILFKP